MIHVGMYVLWFFGVSVFCLGVDSVMVKPFSVPIDVRFVVVILQPIDLPSDMAFSSPLVQLI